MKTKKTKVLLSAAVVLLIAWAFASCSKKDASPTTVNSDKTALNVSLDTGINLLLNTSEGVATGQFEVGSKAPLFTAVDNAQIVIDNLSATQDVVTNANASLTAAIATYKSHYITPIDPATLVGYWTFDDVTAVTAGSTVTDHAPVPHNGTIKAGHDHWGGGLPTQTADRKGAANKALHFDLGSNIEIPYAPALNPTNISISLWAKQDVQSPDPIYADQYMVAMNRWNGYKLQFQGDPKAFFTAHALVSAGDTTYYDHDDANLILNQGFWWHIVVTFGGGHEIFYINGVMVKDWGANSDGVPGTILSLSAHPVNLVIGQDLPTSVYVSGDDSSPYYLNYGGFFKGTLDEIRIYNTVLTGPQAASIYNAEKP